MGVVILLITTIIWGTAFLAQKLGANHLGPFAMTCFRNILGGVFLVIMMAIKSRRFDRASVIGGVACGVPLCAAMLAQQIGIEHTMPGISAFLTTNYVLFVPLIAAVLTRRLPNWYIIVGALMALGGVYLICMNGLELTSVGSGEAWTILCAFLFAIQMIVVDHFARKCDILVMSAVQLFVAAILASPFLALANEASRLSFDNVIAAWLPLVYCGVFSSGIAYTLQNVGQSKTPPAIAAIVLSLESVFGTLSGWIVLGDQFTISQCIGCALVFAAVIFVETIKVINKNGYQKM